MPYVNGLADGHLRRLELLLFEIVVIARHGGKGRRPVDVEPQDSGRGLVVILTAEVEGFKFRQKTRAVLDKTQRLSQVECREWGHRIRQG